MNCSRISPPWIWALGILAAAFAADTISTLASGAEARRYDLNPVIRDLSAPAYLGWSMARFIIGAGILSMFWPRQLHLRPWFAVHQQMALIVPASFRRPYSYLASQAVIVISGVKLAAAASNIYLLATGHVRGADWIIISAGAGVGILASNRLLLWQAGLSAGSS